MVNHLIHGLLNLRGLEVYLVVAALCFGEAAVFLGFVLPGETAVIIGGVIASEGHISLPLIAVIVVAAAICGDTVGYAVGKRFGPVILSHRPLKGKPAVAKTQEFVRRRGGAAVFFGRFTAIFRALVPGVAGMSGVRYRRFLVFNALGGIIWGTGYTTAGYLVGKSYQKLESAASYVSYAVLGIAILFVAYEIRKRVIEHRKHAALTATVTATAAAVAAEESRVEIATAEGTPALAVAAQATPVAGAVASPGDDLGEEPLARPAVALEET